MTNVTTRVIKPWAAMIAITVSLLVGLWILRRNGASTPNQQTRAFLKGGSPQVPQPSSGNAVDNTNHKISAVTKPDDRVVDHSDHFPVGENREKSVSTQQEGETSRRSEAEEKAFAKLAHEFGVWSSVIDTRNEVFIFIDGRYVTPPYSLRRNGYTVTLNDTTLYSSPPVPDGYETSLPEVPPQLDATSTRSEIWGRRQNGRTWLHRFINWHFSQLAPNDAADAALGRIRKMPFVKSIQVENDYRSTDFFDSPVQIKVGWKLITQRDEVMKFDFREGYPNLHPFSKDAFQTLLETQLFNPIKKATQEGGVILIDTHPSCVSFHACRNIEGIAIVMDVMRSSRPNEYKRQTVAAAFQLDSIRIVDAESHLRNFISGFRVNVEFESRVNELLQKKPLKRWVDKD